MNARILTRSVSEGIPRLHGIPRLRFGLVWDECPDTNPKRKRGDPSPARDPLAYASGWCGMNARILTRSVSEGIPRLHGIPRLRFGLVWDECPDTNPKRKRGDPSLARDPSLTLRVGVG